MVTLGDVWAITALVVGIGASIWGLLLCLALLFQRRARVACDLIQSGATRSVFIGALWTFILAGGGFVLLAMPQPVVKLAGWVLLLALMGISFVGSAGLVLLAGERLREIDGQISAYGAFSRGAMFVVLPCLLPILGWFLVAPVIFCLGFGVGLKAIRYKEAPAAPMVPPVVA